MPIVHVHAPNLRQLPEGLLRLAPHALESAYPTRNPPHTCAFYGAFPSALPLDHIWLEET